MNPIRRVGMFFFLAYLFVLPCAFALESPINVLNDLSYRVIDELKREKATIKNKPQMVYRIVNRIILPYVDVKAMSRSALGRTVWLQATPAQRDRFSKEFVQVVVRTYGSALANYTNEKVQFYPLRGDYRTASRVEVDSDIVRTDGPPIRLTYRVVRSGDSWKVYDMSVEGVSLLHSFRSEFAQELSRGSLDQLIARLAERNRQNG